MHSKAPANEDLKLGAVVLAGGQGSRMNGVDKGLQLLHSQSLVTHAVKRLQAQTIAITAIAINANRNLRNYQKLGFEVWPDEQSDFAGPLAGFMVAMKHCAYPYLLTVPCDTPLFPLNLAEKLTQSLRSHDAEIALAATPDVDGVLRRQPVFCVLKVSLKDSLQHFMAEGGRKVGAWTALHHTVEVPFEDPLAFCNLNTVEDLRQLESMPPQVNKSEH